MYVYVCICMYVCVKVECQSVEEACEAASAGADIVMLDNFKAVRKSRRGRLLVYVCMYVCMYVCIYVYRTISMVQRNRSS